MQVALAPLWRGRPQRQVRRSVGDEVVLLAIGVVPMAGPLPGARRPDQFGSHGIEVAVAHDLELMAVVLDERGAQALHDDLSAAVGPPIVPVGEPPVDDLPEGAESDLAFGGPAHDVRMGAHEAVGDDLDAELLLVLPEECEERLAGGVGVEDEAEAVAAARAVGGGVRGDQTTVGQTMDGAPPKASCAPWWG